MISDHSMYVYYKDDKKRMCDHMRSFKKKINIGWLYAFSILIEQKAGSKHTVFNRKHFDLDNKIND